MTKIKKLTFENINPLTSKQMKLIVGGSGILGTGSGDADTGLMIGCPAQSVICSGPCNTPGGNRGQCQLDVITTGRPLCVCAGGSF